MKKLAAYINEQNESVYVPRGLMIVNPMERGLRVVSFSVNSGKLQLHTPKAKILILWTFNTSKNSMSDVFVV